MKHFVINIFFSIFILLTLSACRSVPYSDRSQLLLTSTSQEAELGNQAWQEILSKSKLSSNKVYNAAVKRVGKNISKVVDAPDYKWEFKVFESNEPNAFCLPGGKVGVYSGLFKYADNDAELGAVIGHEIAHAIARHGGERLSHSLLQQLGQQLLLSTVEADEAWQAAYGVATHVGAVLPYSRTHEYEADKLGLIFMAKAGYNPQAALDFWKKFSTLSNTGELGEFLSTHPMGSKRMEEMRQQLPMAMQLYNKAPHKYGYGTKYK